MVVLNSKSIKKSFFLIALSVSVLLSCSKDRLIDVEPYVYPVEYWKKDSLVYTLYQDSAELNQQVTLYGVSSPDTLTLYYETKEYSLSFLEENKDSVFVGQIAGSFNFELDSLFLLNDVESLRRKVIVKEDSSMVLEYTLVNGIYTREYRDYYSLLDITAEVPQISFLNDIYTPIFYNNGDGRCMPCHNSDGGQIRLAPANIAYENLINGVSKNDGGVDYINVLQAEESYIYRLVVGENVEYAMPPNNALTPFEAQTILTWISQGAQDN
jgi:hypothetical protein